MARTKTDSDKLDFLEDLFYTSFPTSLRRKGILNDMKQVESLPGIKKNVIVLPTLVIHAENDPIVPIESGEYTAQNIAGSQFLRLEKGGHFCAVTHREQVVSEIF